MINGSNILNNYSSLKLMLGVIKNHSISLGNDKITLEKNLSKLWILINFLNTFSQVLLIFISGWLAYNKIVSYGIIISVGNLSNQLFNSLQSFGEVYSKYILSKSILRKYDLDLAKEMLAHKKNDKVVIVGDNIEEDILNKADYVFNVENINYTVENEVLLPLQQIIFGQMLSLLKSVNLGITPDNPCPTGEVNRVVQGVILHELV